MIERIDSVIRQIKKNLNYNIVPRKSVSGRIECTFRGKYGKWRQRNVFLFRTQFMLRHSIPDPLFFFFFPTIYYKQISNIAVYISTTMGPLRKKWQKNKNRIFSIDKSHIFHGWERDREFRKEKITTREN